MSAGGFRPFCRRGRAPRTARFLCILGIDGWERQPNGKRNGTCLGLRVSGGHSAPAVTVVLSGLTVDRDREGPDHRARRHQGSRGSQARPMSDLVGDARRHHHRISGDPILNSIGPHLAAPLSTPSARHSISRTCAWAPKSHSLRSFAAKLLSMRAWSVRGWSRSSPRVVDDSDLTLVRAVLHLYGQQTGLLLRPIDRTARDRATRISQHPRTWTLSTRSGLCSRLPARCDP